MFNSENQIKAYIPISNKISDVIAYAFSLPEKQIYVCNSALQDGVIVNAMSVFV